MYSPLSSSFFLHATATPQLYTLSLHDALPISAAAEMLADTADHQHLDVVVDVGLEHQVGVDLAHAGGHGVLGGGTVEGQDRKSTRLNSSHVSISYAVFCLKKKKEQYSVI